VFATPRAAATVILLRSTGRAPGFEAFLLRRVKDASFMSSAYVFPGGAADPEDGDPRVTAGRELFEEAGVLIARGAAPADLAELRRRVLDKEETVPEIDVDQFHYWSHWITPSVEKKRFSARFYVAVCPADQEPSFDARETVEQAWVTPAEALDRAGELRLPPPQLRTFFELAALGSIDEVLAACHRRAAAPHPVMPRLAPQGSGFALLLPWDPEYETAGTGDASPMPLDHPLAEGPSRFVMDGQAWKHIGPP
jgi:8-oxo-dGTP pyrophosphatase MutT (NUDIX family)